MIAGALLGLDRGARGQAAGLRTIILVALAAAIAMVQANILLPVDGKTSASFGVLDLMRLPLGVLTGVGFIGGVGIPALAGFADPRAAGAEPVVARDRAAASGPR